MTNAAKFKKDFGFDYSELERYLVDSEWWNQEYRVPGVSYEWKNHKCRECKYLNLQHKTNIGYRCERPDYQHSTKYGHLKYLGTHACRGFVSKENNNE